MPTAPHYTSYAVYQENNGVWIDKLYLCFKSKSILHDGKINELSELSFSLLMTLLEHAPNPLTTHQLLDIVWQDVVTGEENVKQRISLLRKSLGQNDHQVYIQNIRGQGYFLGTQIKPDPIHAPARPNTLPRLHPAIAATLVLVTGFATSFAYQWLLPKSEVQMDVRIDNAIRLAQKQHDLAFCLDGLDDYVEIQDQDNLDVKEGDFAIDTWVRTKSLEQRVILDKRFEERYKDVKGYVMYINEGWLAFQLATGNGSWHCQTVDSQCSFFVSNGFIADDQWHHVAVSIDRDNPRGLEFYLDGKRITVADPTLHRGSLENDNPLRIGSRSSYTTGLFEGAIGAVNLYHRTLNADEVAGLYSQGNQRRCYSIATQGGV